MAEAVIVSTARRPIGRAFKGSLKDERPDDLAAAMIDAVVGKTPGLDRSTVDDIYLGCAEPSGEAGPNMARVAGVLAGMDFRSRRDGEQVLSFEHSNSAHGLPHHQGR